jgi:II/X family phage/plasmid replication protein
MIDWFRGAITFNHVPIPSGSVLSLKPDGAIEWTSLKKTMVRSSWETGLNIKSVVTNLEGGHPYSNLLGKEVYRFQLENKLADNIPVYILLPSQKIKRLTHDFLREKMSQDESIQYYEPMLEFTPYEGFATTLFIDGNLCKFLQGHNIFGSRDLNRLLYLAFKKIVFFLSDHFQGHDLQIRAAEKQILAGEYLVKMLDINQLYDCGNDLSVESWLHAAEMRAVSRGGRAKRDKGTVYLAKNSKRHAFKFYNKYREINADKKHRLPNELQGLGLESFVLGKLRGELRIFGKELQERHGITHGKHLDETVIQTLYNDYISRITMTAQVHLIDEQLMALPRNVQMTYDYWRRGLSCKELLPRNTFYRHRKILLEHGVDILSNCLEPEELAKSNVVPMIRIIEAIPVAIPQWAYEKNLIAM